MISPPAKSGSSFRIEVGVIIAAAIGWTVVFFLPLWRNEGLVGGDVMTYFLPQKAYLVDALRAGDLPLWCNTVALGYPFVADSQIALWYPTTLPLYSLFSAETGFHINTLLHYVFAYVGATLLGRRFGLTLPTALFASLAFVYGWFAPRMTVEWAVTTGSFLPWALLCVERFLCGGRLRDLGWLTGLLTLQLLAGHFSLTFITHAMLPLYVLLRTTVGRETAFVVRWPRAIAAVLAAQVVAFPLAACQLMPTWELRQSSERGGLPIPDVDYGRVPWQHLKQLVLPSAAAEDVNQFGGADTNPPAASLYVGPLTVGFAIIGLLVGGRLRRVWCVLIPLSVVFAVGWVTPTYQHVPGFGYFKIPGRYGIVAALGLAVLGGAGLQRVTEWVPERFHPARWLVPGLAVGLLAANLYWHSRAVTFTEFVPIHSRDLVEESELRDVLEADAAVPRVWMPGQNTLAVLGLSVVPGFVGLPPDAYVDAATRPPQEIDPAGPTPGQLDRARRYGVTHILFDSQPNLAAWECEPVAAVLDPFLTRVMQRFDPATGEYRPFFVGRLTRTRGRAATVTGRGEVEVVTYEPDRVELAVETASAERVVLADLAFPGWRVTVDGVSAEAVVLDDVLRGVDVPAGRHAVVWEYRPASVRLGWLVSLATAATLAAAGVAARRSRRHAAATLR